MSTSSSILNDPDACLLLYAAGELADGDQAAIEQMLAADPSLRCRLDDVRQLLDATDERLAAGDRVASRTSAGPAAVDRVAARAAAGVRAWQAGNRPSRANAPAAALIPWRRFAVPAAAAAAIVALLSGGFVLRNMGTPSLAPLPRLAVDRSAQGSTTPEGPTTGEPDGLGVRESFALLRAVGEFGPAADDREVPLLPPLSPAELARGSGGAVPSPTDPAPAFPADALASAASDGPFFDVPLDLAVDAAPARPDNDPPLHQPLP